MFRVFAHAQLSAVPVIRLRSVKGESSIADAMGVTATGNKEYAVVVVKTIRKESRGLDKERYVKKRCFREFCGKAEEIEESREEASSGIGTSSSGGSSGCSLRFRLRCGKTPSSVFEVVAVMLCNAGSGVSVEDIEFAVLVLALGFVVNLSSVTQLPFQRSLSRKNFFFSTSRCL